MTVEDIRNMLRRQPFEPFTIFLSDGRSLEVRNRDFVFLPERGSSFFVVGNDGFEFVYLRNVTSLRSTGNPPTAAGSPRSGEDAA